MALTVTHAKRERFNYKHSIHHVITRCNNKAFLIRNNPDFENYKRILKACKEKYGFLLHDYVIMNNHVHLLIKLEEIENISMIMHSINRWYARWYNELYERKGHFWEDRFYAELIKDDMQLLAAMRYIDLNPVRTGLCKDPIEWHFSGARHYLKCEEDDLIDMPETYINLGDSTAGRQKAYSNIFPILLTRQF